METFRSRFFSRDCLVRDLFIEIIHLSKLSMEQQFLKFYSPPRPMPHSFKILIPRDATGTFKISDAKVIEYSSLTSNNEIKVSTCINGTVWDIYSMEKPGVNVTLPTQDCRAYYNFLPLKKVKADDLKGFLCYLSEQSCKYYNERLLVADDSCASDNSDSQDK